MKSTYKILYKHLTDKKTLGVLFLGSMLANLLAGCMEGVSYALMISAFFVLSGGISDHALFHLLPPSLGLLVTLALLSQVIKSGLFYLGVFFGAKFLLKVQEDLQIQLYRLLVTMDYGRVSAYQVGQLSEFVRAPNALRTVVEHLNLCIVYLIMIGISLCLLLYLSIPLTLALLLFSGTAYFIQKNYIHKISHLSTLLAGTLEQLTAKITETLSHLRLVHLYNYQEKVLGTVKGLLKDFSSTSKGLILGNGLVITISEIFGMFLVGSSLLLGAFFLPAGPGQFPLLLAAMTITYRMTSKLQGLMGCLSQIGGGYGCLAQMALLLNLKTDSRVKVGHAFEKLESTIEFQNVSFSYPSGDQNVVSELSCILEKGQTMAIIGPSGSGKSTLCNLLGGLYAPSSGHILVDGVRLDELDRTAWRSKLAVVTQEIFLFHDTLEENIRFGYPATHAAVKKAAEMAAADSFIEKLSKGYQTVVGESAVRLSGGERQRIALARALLRDPDILIIDEGTSHLDLFSEQWIQETLETLRGKMTIILVTHRLNLAQSADQILMLEAGKIVALGRHHHLSLHEPKYAEFWNLQPK